MKFRALLLLLPLSDFIAKCHSIPQMILERCKDNESCLRKASIHQKKKLKNNLEHGIADAIDINKFGDAVIIQQEKNLRLLNADTDETFNDFDMDIYNLRNVLTSYRDERVFDFGGQEIEYSGWSVSIWNFNTKVGDYVGWSSRILFQNAAVIDVAVSSKDNGWIAVRTDRYVHLFKCKDKGYSWSNVTMIPVGGTQGDTLALSSEGPLRLAFYKSTSQSILVYEDPWVNPISELMVENIDPDIKPHLSPSFRNGDYITFGYNGLDYNGLGIVRVCDYRVADQVKIRTIDNPGGHYKGFSAVDKVDDVLAIGISNEVVIYRQDEMYVITGPSFSSCGTSISLSSDGTRIAIGCPGDTNKLHIYDYQEANNQWNLNSFSSMATYGDHVKISADGKLVMTVGDNTKFVHEWVEPAGVQRGMRQINMR